MTSPDSPQDPASALLEAAHAFHRAAEVRGSHRAAPEALASMQDALQVLSAAWYRLAADAVRTGPLGVDPEADPRRSDLTREQEVTLIGALHDVAAAFARSARACREGASTVTPLIARHGETSWFATRQPGTERVA